MDLEDLEDLEYLRKARRALGEAFIWAISPQGSAYWEEVDSNLAAMIQEIEACKK